MVLRRTQVNTVLRADHACGARRGSFRVAAALLATTCAVLGIVAGLAPVVSGQQPAPTAAPLVSDHQLRVGRTVRRYRLVLPRPEARGMRLVVMFHGGGRKEDGSTIAAQTGFDGLAVRHGWAVAYPVGQDGDWNAGPCCSSTGRHANDIAFFDALLNDLGRRGIRTQRVGVAGFSAGAFFVHRLACQRASRIAAAVAVAGTLLTDPCRPAVPVPIAMIWNGADKRVPPSGGTPASFIKLGAYALHRRWSQLNHCGAQTRPQVAGGTARVGGRCASGSVVRTYVVNGTAHLWPLRSPTNGFDATEVAERFFAPRLSR